jgi:hypothetical protein
MKKTRFIALAAILAWGCGGSVKNEGDGDTDATTDVPTEMTGDVETDVDEDGETDVSVPDGGDDVVADTPADTEPDGTGCTDGELRCSSDGRAVEECVDGAWESTACTFGCTDTPDVHCMAWDISNIPDDSLLSLGEDYCGDPWPSDTDATYEMRMDTDTGQIDVYEFTDGWTHVLEIRPADRGLNPESCIGFTVVDQGTDLPELGVFSFQQLDVPANYVVTAYGSRPMVLLSEDAATIAGGVYAGCNWRDTETYGGAVRSDEGPGAGGAGDSMSASTGFRDGGGGGGAFGGAGGTGGGYDTSIRGAGGATYGTPELIPLLAGSGGGQGGGDGDGRWGGRSGGAVMIASGDTLTITGWVDASGCGGRTASGNEGGGGGGSGGGIILESPALVITGGVSANGGGGGSGGRDGENGEDGLVDSDTAAAGGTASTTYTMTCDGGDGNGGGGADGADAPTCDTSEDDYNAGGGGGGSGIIRLNGEARVLTDALLSPDPSSGACTESGLTIG